MRFSIDLDLLRLLLRGGDPGNTLRCRANEPRVNNLILHYPRQLDSASETGTQDNLSPSSVRPRGSPQRLENTPASSKQSAVSEEYVTTPLLEAKDFGNTRLPRVYFDAFPRIQIVITHERQARATVFDERSVVEGKSRVSHAVIDTLHLTSR